MTRRYRSSRNTLMTTLAVSALAVALPLHAAEPDHILVPGTGIFPESLTSTQDGTVIIGSIGTGTIFRALPGAMTAEAWIASGTDGMQNVFGVFADDANNTLWACSGTAGARNENTPASALYAFDLKSGTVKGHWPMPTAGGFCNDIAVGSDGTAYAADTTNMEVARLTKGATAMTSWAANGVFGPKGGGVDGIAVIDKRVIVNTLFTGKLFAVDIAADGSAGKTVELQLDRALERPDGMRSVANNELLTVEGGSGGRLSRITLAGDSGTVVTLKQGYPDGPVGVTVVGKTAYVLEGQLSAMRNTNAAPKPFQATAVKLP
jgi:sugar lactone lactonase YvrE